MKWLTQFSLIMRSSLTTLSEKMENPERTLHQLVIDMAAQRAGNDGAVDTIRVKRNGLHVEVYLNDALAHRELAANLTGVAIRGSSDVDSVLADQNLGVPLTVDGGSGRDRLVINPTTAANRGADAVTVNSNAVAVNSWVVNYAGIEGKWYFDRKDAKLLAAEIQVLRDEDPCELYFSDYKPIDGRSLPHRIDVRWGDKNYGSLSFTKFDLKK